MFIQGKLLALLIENDLFNVKEVEDNSKLDIDYEGLLHISNDYSLNPEKEGTTVKNNKIILSDEDKVETTMRITAILLSNLSQSITRLPKKKECYAKENRINYQWV